MIHNELIASDIDSKDISVEGRIHSPGRVCTPMGDPDAPVGLRVRTMERTALVRFENALNLFNEASIREVSDQLRKLVEQECHHRLLVNLRGVRYLSSDMLATLAVLQKMVDPAQGCIQLCGLDPLMQDMLRITYLDRTFDVCADEA